MIEMNNLALMQAAGALRELSMQPMPAAACVKAVRMTRAVETAAEEVEKTRLATVERYTERDAGGNPVSAVDAEGQEIDGHVRLNDPDAYHREMHALLTGVARLDVEPLRLDELGPELRISPRVMLGLGPLLQAGEEPAPAADGA